MQESQPLFQVATSSKMRLARNFILAGKLKKISGFPSEGHVRPRAYVPHLIDAVQTYFLIIDNLIKGNLFVKKDDVLQALNGTGLDLKRLSVAAAQSHLTLLQHVEV